MDETELQAFQRLVRNWGRDIWPEDEEPAVTVEERMERFFEEAAEFAQTRLPKEQVQKILNRVYSRPIGDPFQELGGVMVVLAFAADKMGLSTADAAWTEFQRIDTPAMKAKIKARNDEKRTLFNTKTSEEPDYTGTICSRCGCPQFNTPSGVSCQNGDGGADPLIV